jgi:hypothetical protein
MSRSVGSNFATAAVAATYQYAWLVTLELDSGTLRFWTGLGDKTIGGAVYTGTGTLGSVSPVEESTDIKPNGIKMMLAGQNPAMISIASGEHYQGRTCRVAFALFDTTWAVIDDPLTVFVGRLDVMTTIDYGAHCTLEVTAENRLVDFERPGEILYYTHQDQLRLYPGDLGLEYMAALVEAEIWWGQKQPGAVSSTVTGPGGDGSGITTPAPIQVPDTNDDSTEDQGSSFIEEPEDIRNSGTSGPSENEGYNEGVDFGMGETHDDGGSFGGFEGDWWG